MFVFLRHNFSYPYHSHSQQEVCKLPIDPNVPHHAKTSTHQSPVHQHCIELVVICCTEVLKKLNKKELNSIYTNLFLYISILIQKKL